MEPQLALNYSGGDNYGTPKQVYLDKLAAMTDDMLFEHCCLLIWFAAYAQNNPRSDYHWQASACSDESASPGRRPNIYKDAYDKIVSDNRG